MNPETDQRTAGAHRHDGQGMGTCAAPIEAPAGCAQAGEAGIVGPQKEARHTGNSNRSDAPAPERARGVVPYAFRVLPGGVAHG